jgi:gliding motility-associated-like protein
MAMKNITSVASVIASILLAHNAGAQIFTSNGAIVFVANGAIVHSNGGMTVDNISAFTNNGTVTITKNSTLPVPGTITIDNASTVQGDGTYRVEQDWINNATFNGGNSTVELFGTTQQLITSTNATVTTFNNLTLTGTGTGNNRKKSLQGVNARTGLTGVLNIGDRELETQQQTFFVLNPATTAVLNVNTPGAEGFVSSIAPGTFSRLTNAASAYLYPTGSSVVSTRYRPVVITPTAAAGNEYTVRFVNNDPDVDGFNRSINDGLFCLANDTFYHAILRPNGATSADIMLHYIPATDGTWSGMSHWRTTNNQWNDMATVVPSTSGIFTTLNRQGWLFANPGEPYVLTDVRPAAPTVTCPNVCENSSGNLYSVTGGTGGGYLWNVAPNGTIAAGQGGDSLLVDWTTGSGYVTVVSVSPTGCNSLPDSCFTQPVAAPLGAFADSSFGMFSNDFIFLDQSVGGNSWSWDFGDGNSSTTQNPTHEYGASGTYTVVLTVTNAAGCVDTVMQVVTVTEGILIPNVFTPNGDGVNDEFFIPNSGLKEYSLEIYDRWGVLIFNSTAPDVRWDGRTNSGQPCTDGTYYYILKAVSNTADYSTTGFLTLFGSQR